MEQRCTWRQYAVWQNYKLRFFFCFSLVLVVQVAAVAGFAREYFTFYVRILERSWVGGAEQTADYVLECVYVGQTSSHRMAEICLHWTFWTTHAHQRWTHLTYTQTLTYICIHWACFALNAFHQFGFACMFAYIFASLHFHRLNVYLLRICEIVFCHPPHFRFHFAFDYLNVAKWMSPRRLWVTTVWSLDSRIQYTYIYTHAFL